MRDEQLLDSYQNPVYSPLTNESIEAVGIVRDGVEHVSHQDGYMEVATIYADEDAPWKSDEDAERLAGDLSSDHAEGDSGSRAPSGHDSGDRNEPGYAHQEDKPETKQDGERGRASSGESYEDEADNAIFRQPTP